MFFGAKLELNLQSENMALLPSLGGAINGGVGKKVIWISNF